MNSLMLNIPNSVFGSWRMPRAQVVARESMGVGNALLIRALPAALLSVGLLAAVPSLAAVAAASQPQMQPQSEASKSVQAEVDKQAVDVASERRKKLLADATSAVSQTEQALRALEAKKSDEALKALADATGKLKLIVARDPSLKFAPVSTTVATYDLLASPETVKAAMSAAKDALNEGDAPHARALVNALVSEVQVRTTNIPLATYPAAIKAVTPLIDAGKIDEARSELQTALSTLVVTTDVLPLPKLRAEGLLKDAQALAEKKDRKEEDNKRLSIDLEAARSQLQMGELLGYGKKRDYQPMYQQLTSIEKASAGGRSDTGWFETIKKQVADIF